MDLNTKQVKEAIILSLITGVIISITYPTIISYHHNDFWAMLMWMTFGPFFIISTLGLFFFIQRNGNSIYNIIALIFHVLAGLSNTLMFAVQHAVFSVRTEYRTLENELSKEILQQSFKIGNLAQLGMDFCFDIFVSLGIIFLGLALLKQDKLFRWLTFPAIIIGFAGLYLNMITFPIPPSNTYFDAGPFFGFYFGILLINMLYVILKSRKNNIPWI